MSKYLAKIAQSNKKSTDFQPPDIQYGTGYLQTKPQDIGLPASGQPDTISSPAGESIYLQKIRRGEIRTPDIQYSPVDLPYARPEQLGLGGRTEVIEPKKNPSFLGGFFGGIGDTLRSFSKGYQTLHSLPTKIGKASVDVVTHPRQSTDSALQFLKEGVVDAPARAIASGVLSATGVREYQPETPLAKTLFGEEQINDIETKGKNFQALFGQKDGKGFFGTMNPFGLGLALVAADLYPGGFGKKAGEKALIKLLTKEVSEDVVKNTLKKNLAHLGEEEIARIAPQIARSKTQQETKNIINASLQKVGSVKAAQTTTPSQVDNLLAEARNYKSAEEFVNSVLYHGSETGFNVYDFSRAGKGSTGNAFGTGAYFTDKFRNASDYASGYGNVNAVLRGKEGTLNGKVLFTLKPTGKLLNLDTFLRESRPLSFYKEGLKKMENSGFTNVSKDPNVIQQLKKGVNDVSIDEVLSRLDIEISNNAEYAKVLGDSYSIYDYFLPKDKYIGAYDVAAQYGAPGKMGKQTGKGAKDFVLWDKGSQIKMFETNKELTKSQLTDIWNEANKKRVLSDELPKTDTITKFINALKEAEPLQAEQAKLYTAERAKRAARVKAVGESMSGEKGFFAQLGQLKGELPKKNFQAIRGKFGQPEVDTLFDAVEHHSALTTFEKVSTKGALAKLFNGTVPTKGELSLLREVFGEDVVKAIPIKKTKLEKLLDFTSKAVNLPRSIMATVDLSAPLRQGIFLIGKPKQFLPAFANMFRYAASERAYKGLMEDIAKRPIYKQMRRAKVSFTDLAEDLSRREERFISNWSEKIPGFGVLAKASNRAYTGFLNKLRADVFEDVFKKATAAGYDTTNEQWLRGLGRYVNSASGRGEFGIKNTLIIPQGAEKIPVGLSNLFFSPRLMASRLSLLNPLFYYNLPPFVRKEALKSLLAFGGIAGTVLGLAKISGGEDVDIVVDPRNADFGKIKIGNIRYDVLGGFQQYIRAAAQLQQGEIVSSTTGRVMTVGEGYKPLTRYEIAERFFENKTAPIPSFIIQLLEGTTATGEDFDVPTEVINRFIPMVVQDLYDISREKGIENIWQGAPAIFGVGTQVYGKQEFVVGKTEIGEKTGQIRPVQELGEKVREIVFGSIPLGTTKSFSAQAYFEQLKKMPKEDATEILKLMKENNPDLIKKLSDVAKEKALGITPHDRDLKGMGVQSGDRAKAIVNDLKKLQTKEEQAKLLLDYKKKGILSADVTRQILLILSQQRGR